MASSIVAAVRYKYELETAIKEKIAQLKALPDEERDDERIKQLEFLKVAAVVSGMGNNEPGYISKARSEAKDWDANSFKKDFDYSKKKVVNTKSPNQALEFCVFVTAC